MNLLDAHYHRRVADSFNRKKIAHQLMQLLAKKISEEAEEGKYSFSYSTIVPGESEALKEVADILRFKGYRVEFPRAYLRTTMNIHWD